MMREIMEQRRYEVYLESGGNATLLKTWAESGGRRQAIKELMVQKNERLDDLCRLLQKS